MKYSNTLSEMSDEIKKKEISTKNELEKEKTENK